ncbi:MULTISPECIES: hypothetical protein [Mesorhizobium]|nr:MULTISPECIES: hypothetical protein [Mesorhizobium]MDF3208363.1 hypothetical protein [Mesorhizobium sp. LMG15046]MDF3229065.1 hypothetical protein [Mesorhizobium sp. DSM 30133]
MTPHLAALRYITLATFSRRAAIRFAMNYEATCGSEAAFDEYLSYLD